MSLTVKVRSTSESVTIKRKKFDPSQHTVYDIKLAYCDEHNNKKQPQTITFRVRGKELKPDTAKLVDCGIKANSKMLIATMSSKLGGGALYVPQNILNSKRARKLNKLDSEIKVTNKQCCVYLDKKGERAELPCGDAFTPQSMFDTLKALLQGSGCEYDVKCPGCGTTLDFDLCAKIADLNDEEYEYFLEEIEKRASPETRPCPDCGIDCERPDTLKMFRVNCTSCSGGDWCFLCAQKWNASGFTVCGNNNCELYDINAVLKECPLKKATNGIPIPEMRACPSCLNFIDHSDACKHMTCDQCKHEFCFSCLKPKLNGNWQCGNYDEHCAVAPRQQF